MAEACLPSENAAASGIGNSSSGNLSSTIKTSTSSEASDASSAAGGGSSSATSESATGKSSESSTSKNVSEYLDSFIKSVEQKANLSGIQDVTGTINDTDCSEAVYDFLAANVPGFSTAMSWINKGTDFMKNLSSGVSISSSVGGNEYVQKVCDILSVGYGTAIAYIEVVVKGAFVLFKKIDALRERLENALLSLNSAIERCILDVLDDLVAKLKQILKLSINIDWTALLKLMRDCPCLTQVVASLTGCTKDDAGNDITGNPASVILCIQNKYDFLDASALSAGLEKMYERYVRQYVKITFDYIGTWITFVFNLIIKPLRSLIKKYAKLLTKKFDVTGFIDGLGAFKCFFVYSEEYRDGDTYKGMSVIDMLNTFTQWIPCLEHACPSFSEKVKNKSKEIYKDLRLDDKYWRNAYEMDLYVICLGAKAGTETPLESTMRSLYVESTLDLIMSWWRGKKNSGDDDSDDPEEEIEEIPTDEEIAEYKEEHAGQSPTNAPNEFTQSVKFTDAPETENEVNVGDREIGTAEENLIIDIIHNLGAGDDSFFTEKLYQLVRLMNFYHTSPTYVKNAKEALENVENLSGNYRVQNSTLTYANQRKSLSYDKTELEVTYEVPSDYDEDLCTRMQSSDIFLMQRGENETRIDFYSRMYEKAMAE